MSINPTEGATVATVSGDKVTLNLSALGQLAKAAWARHPNNVQETVAISSASSAAGCYGQVFR
jgi:hypothetical protein